jgi:hypothetical protein
MFIEWKPVVDERNIYYEIRKGDNWDSAPVLITTTSTKIQVTSSGTYWIATACEGTNEILYATPVSIQIDYTIVGTIIGTNEESNNYWAGSSTNTIVIP